MLVGLIGGFLRGRYVCGWLCPRGAFYDRVISRISPQKKIPGFLRNYWFRGFILIVLMGFMVYQISFNPGDVYHWGKVFVRICIITTAIGVVLAVFTHPRTWCAFCPMGTIQSAAGGTKSPLKMEEGCKLCRTCEKACPLDLQIVGGTKEGRLTTRDCLKCPECQLKCPQKILHF
jgi:polyferredoxin